MLCCNSAWDWSYQLTAVHSRTVKFKQAKLRPKCAVCHIDTHTTHLFLPLKFIRHHWHQTLLPIVSVVFVVVINHCTLSATFTFLSCAFFFYCVNSPVHLCFCFFVFCFCISSKRLCFLLCSFFSSSSWVLVVAPSSALFPITSTTTNFFLLFHLVHHLHHPKLGISRLHHQSARSIPHRHPSAFSTSQPSRWPWQCVASGAALGPSWWSASRTRRGQNLAGKCSFCFLPRFIIF